MESYAHTKLPWYQFSLRSLLLLTLFVAVLCSIGVCTHYWLVSVAAAAIFLLGGTMGRIVAGSRVGFWQGGLGTFACFLGVFIWKCDLYHGAWLCAPVSGIAALIGVFLVSCSVRPRSKHRLSRRPGLY